MWLFAALVLCLCAHTLKAQAPADSPELFRAKQALSRIQILVAEGGLPPKRLEQAREAVRAQLAEREYDLGEYYRRLGYNRAARSHYGAVIKDYPSTRFAEMAKERSDSTVGLPDEPPDYFPWLTKWLGNRNKQ